jgi:hypothetical protein
LALSVGISAIPATSSEDAPWSAGTRPVPVESRNLSWPGILILGFEPAPATTLGKGRVTFATYYSQISNYLVSDNVKQYLLERGEDRPLDENDVAVIQSFEEDAFFFDGELGRLHLSAQYGLTPRMDLVVSADYLGYTGGVLDGLIFNFHENFGIDQNGREFVSEDHFQLVLKAAEGRQSVARLSSPGGGLGDPTVRLRYAFPGFGDGWRLGLETGLKAPIGDEDQLHSSGNADVGIQFALEKRWQRSGMVLNGYWVSAGRIDALEGLDGADPLGLNVSLLRDFNELLTGHLQVTTARSVFHGVTETTLGDPEFQASLGISMRLSGNRRVTFAYTNNVINHDNTPDTIFQLGYARLFD